MMILTAKVDFKKIMLILIIVAVVLFSVIALLSRREETASITSEPVPGSNDSRVQFLKSFGWEVVPSPVESSRVRIPEESGEVFRRYNLLQKGQGYDLTEYAGKKVMRYVYEVKNYPGAVDPVYATVLVHKNKVIGGDVTDSGAKGQIRGFRMPAPAEKNRNESLNVPEGAALPEAGTAPADTGKLPVLEPSAPDAMG